MFEHIERRRRRHRRGGPGAARPAAGSSFFLNHPLLQTPGSGWIDDQVLDPPEQYWRIGPYLAEDVTLEEVEKGVLHPVHPPPAQPLRQRAGRPRPVVTRMDEPAPPPGFLALAPQYQDAATIPRLLVLRAERH